MGYNFRDDNPVLGSNAQLELNNGASAPTLVKMQIFECVSFNAVAAPAAGSISVYVNPQSASVASGFLPLGQYSLVGVSVTFSVASTSGTLDVFNDPTGTAPGAGTSCLTGTISLAGTANTTFNGTLVANPNTLQLAAGGRFSLKFGGTLTNLANLCVNLYIVRSV